MTKLTQLLGRGFEFPLRVDDRGGISVSEGEEKVLQSIQLILGTLPGERLMRPTFGCHLKSLVFAPNNTATAGLAKFYVEDALTRWEPRIEIEEVDVRNEQESRGGHLIVQVRYRLRTTGATSDVTFGVPLAP